MIHKFTSCNNPRIKRPITHLKNICTISILNSTRNRYNSIISTRRWTWRRCTLNPKGVLGLLMDLPTTHYLEQRWATIIINSWHEGGQPGPATHRCNYSNRTRRDSDVPGGRNGKRDVLHILIDRHRESPLRHGMWMDATCRLSHKHIVIILNTSTPHKQTKYYSPNEASQPDANLGDLASRILRIWPRFECRILCSTLELSTITCDRWWYTYRRRQTNKRHAFYGRFSTHCAWQAV